MELLALLIIPMTVLLTSFKISSLLFSPRTCPQCTAEGYLLKTIVNKLEINDIKLMNSSAKWVVSEEILQNAWIWGKITWSNMFRCERDVISRVSMHWLELILKLFYLLLVNCVLTTRGINSHFLQFGWIIKVFYWVLLFSGIITWCGPTAIKLVSQL